MKKVILSVAAIFAFGFVSAQDLKFGIKGGLNVSDLSYGSYGGSDNVDRKAPSSDSKVGFHVGGLVDIKLTDKFSVQPELLFSTQGSKRKETVNEAGYSATSEDNINLSYLNIPVMFKYYVIDKFSLEAGPQIGFLMSAKDKYSYTETFEGTTESSSSEVDVKDLYKSTDFGLNFGAGYDFTENISAGVRYNLGLSDINQAGTVNFNGQDIQVEKGYEEKNSVLQFSVAYKF